MSRIHEQAQQAALPYEDPEEVELEIQRRIRKASSSKVDAFAEGITVTKEGLTVFVPACDISPEFHSEVINRGMDVAAAVEIISKASESLVNEGEPLRRTVEELFMIVKQGVVQAIRLIQGFSTVSFPEPLVFFSKFPG